MAGLSAFDNATALLKEAARANTSPVVPSAADDLGILDAGSFKQETNVPDGHGEEGFEHGPSRPETASTLKSLGIGSHVDLTV